MSDSPDVAKKRSVGRPKKSELEAKKKPGTVGRPKGDAAIIKEYKSRMLASPKSRKVLDSIFNAALDNEHKHQAAAWKLLMDRMLPVAAFEQEVVKNGHKPSFEINITTVEPPEIKHVTEISHSSEEQD